MGKGSNASKIARARAEAAKKADSEKKGAGGGGAKGMAERKGTLALACNICKTGFMSNQAKAQLIAHVESKHSKNTFAECFPTYEEDS